MSLQNFLNLTKKHLDLDDEIQCVIYAVDGTGYPLMSMVCFASMKKEDILDVLRRKTGKQYTDAIIWTKRGVISGWDCLNFPKDRWLWEVQNHYTVLTYREWVRIKISMERAKSCQ